MNAIARLERECARPYLPALTIENEEEFDRLHEAMCELSAREFHVLFLRFWGKHSILEIGRALSMSWDCVDATLNQSLAKLRAALSGSDSPMTIGKKGNEQ